ncbi:synaptopodin 2-like protein isoform X2 [Trichomycterus rosablanca]
MNLIDSIPGLLCIRVKRAPAGFQSVVLVARAPSPRIDKEYRAALRANTPSSSKLHQPSVRQVHHTSVMSPTARSGLTSPLGSEAYYGETDSDADVVTHDRHRRQRHRNPGNPLGKAGHASTEVGETSEMSGYDSATDAQGYPPAGPDHQEGKLPGVVRREVIFQPPSSGAWSSYTSTETSSVSADEQSSQDLVIEEDSGFQELPNVPLVSPERAKEALVLSSHSQLVPMVGPVNNPVDEELTKTYMDKAKQAKLNRGDTLQDKQVKEARTKCRTIASLLTDAPNPHSKGVLMFKKRRQRSKKYTLTSYGSVDEDMQPDSQEEDNHFLGSESELDEEGFSAAPDPTWDSDYLDMLEKRAASRALEGDEADDSLSGGLSGTTGRGARLFEQQRKRAEEHAKKMAQKSQLEGQAIVQAEEKQPELSIQTKAIVKPSVQPPQVAPKPARPPELMTQENTPATKTQIPPTSPRVTFSIVNDIASIKTPTSTEVPENQVITVASVMVPPPSTSMPPPPTPLPELPPSSVLNRTARPFAPGFISHRAATAPVVFRPNVTKKASRPVSVAVTAPPFTTAFEEVIDYPSASFSVRKMSIDVPAGMTSTPAPATTVHLPFPAAMPDPAQSLISNIPSSSENFQTVPSVSQTNIPANSFITENITAAPPSAGFTDITSVISAAIAVPSAPEVPLIHATSVTLTPVTPVSSVSPPAPVVCQEKAPPAGGRTGILQKARRRTTNKPMFKIPDARKNLPNPELLSLVQNWDERPNYGYSEPVTVSDDYYNMDEKRGKIPPPVAPKPRIIPEVSQIPQAGGKGAELFARRQNRKDLFVVDGTQPQQQFLQSQSVMPMIHPCEPSPVSPNWKYSPNVRAPPPIGYNPLLAPSCPLGAQHEKARGAERTSKVGRGGHMFQKEGIKAIDVMRRQPYQLNSAMFGFGGGSSTQSVNSSYQHKRQTETGHTLTKPRQVPVKTSRVYEIKRFSTPTPMSAPTIVPTVIAPRAQTTLAEPLCRYDMTSPTMCSPAAMSSPAQPVPEPAAVSSRPPGLPELPRISAAPAFVPTPYSPPAPVSSMTIYSDLQAARQFKSAPELSALPPNFLKPPVQAPKPRFIATRAGVQPHVWRPGVQHY